MARGVCMHLYVYLVISNAFVYVMQLRWSYHVAQAVLELVLSLTCNPSICTQKVPSSHEGEIHFNPSVGGGGSKYKH